MRPRLGEKPGMTKVLCPSLNMTVAWANNPGSGGKQGDQGPRCTKCGQTGHAIVGK